MCNSLRKEGDHDNEFPTSKVREPSPPQMTKNKSIFHRQISRRSCLLLLTLFVVTIGFASAEPKRSGNGKPVVYNNITRGYFPVDRAAEKVYGREFRIVLIKEKEGFVSAQSKGETSLFGSPLSRLEKASHGPVLCVFIVAADGRPIEPRVLQSPNQRVSDLVASEILSHRFTPARLRGVAVASLHSEEFTIGGRERREPSYDQGKGNPLGLNSR